jgi:hypothetical protein
VKTETQSKKLLIVNLFASQRTLDSLYLSNYVTIDVKDRRGGGRRRQGRALASRT